MAQTRQSLPLYVACYKDHNYIGSVGCKSLSEAPWRQLEVLVLCSTFALPQTKTSSRTKGANIWPKWIFKI